MPTPWESGRIWRLCRKELQETLRDRRTVMTLVLMPILVYPLLSIVMQKLLLSQSDRNRIFYLVGVESKNEGAFLLDLISQAQAVQETNPYQPLKITRTTSSDSKGTNEGKSDPNSNSVPQFNVQVVEKDPNELLREGLLDLAIRIQPGDSTSESNTPPNNNPPAFTPFRLDVLYRQGDSASESAIEQLRTLLQIINDVELGRRAKLRNRDYRGAIEMSAAPLRMQSGGAGGLVSVIPLVLLLMTITGAVYPAIDLTAGERERGTMESLIASPVPRYSLLLSKYVAVVTVAMLTALANLLSMWITLSVTGVGRALFGAEGLTVITMLQIFPLLLVFASFFSSILLTLCSFAKSFKEAQAYLIPVMLVSLGPGLLSLMPGVEFTPTLAVVPLVNIILLARDILTQSAQVVPAFVAILSTMVYAAAILSLAARLFGSDSTLHGGQGTWSDLWAKPDQARDYPAVGQLCTFLGLFYPIYFIVTNLIATQLDTSLGSKLWINAIATFALFLGLPWSFARFRNIHVRTTFRLRTDSFRWWLAVPAVLFLGSSIWMVAHELFVLGLQAHLASLTSEQIELAQKAKVELVKLPLAMILVTSAILPAIAEEFFFRGFVLSSLQRFSMVRQILLSGFLFGLFHVLSGNSLAIERLIPTTFLGIVLGWIACTTRSLYPGIAFHAIHNGLMFTLAYYETWLSERGWGVAERQHLPLPWLAVGAGLLVAGCACLLFSRTPSSEPKTEADASTSPG